MKNKKRIMILALALIVLIFCCTGTGGNQNADWTTYNGQLAGNRFSSLTAINSGNVARLKLVKVFSVLGPNNPYGLETTPLVCAGVMYYTSTNSVYAVSMTPWKTLWSYQIPPTPGLAGDAASGWNRGAALNADCSSIFFATDNAHLVSLSASTGSWQWETVMADSAQNYGSTAAPLYLPGQNIVIAGISGGDPGARGFLAAYAANTGQLLWQFFTTPSGLDDPLAATWIPKGTRTPLPHGGGATWMTGTFDSVSNILYWPTGNPTENFNGDNRKGDNLYTSSVLALALDPNTGALLNSTTPTWYFQYTPHSVWDYDGTNAPLLIDSTWQGSPRNLLFHADRNGFFYVLDRNTGQFLNGFAFVNQTWASSLGATGRPVVNPAAIPIPRNKGGSTVCPGHAGATNWMSPAFSPVTGLFYVQALERCDIYYKGPLGPWEPVQDYAGGWVQVTSPGTKYLRAIDPTSGAIVWQYQQNPGSGSMAGVLATAGGLVFAGEQGGAFSAFDAGTGTLLWRDAASNHAGWKSSPMTCMVNGIQYVVVATSNSILVYGLPAIEPTSGNTPSPR